MEEMEDMEDMEDGDQDDQHKEIDEEDQEKIEKEDEASSQKMESIVTGRKFITDLQSPSQLANLSNFWVITYCIC